MDSAAHATGSSDRPTWFRGKLAFWLPIVPLVALDLWSKAWVFGMLEERLPSTHPTHRALEVFDFGFLRFDLVQWYNEGTIWGLFQDHNLALRLLRTLALPLLVYFGWRTSRTKKLQLLVLGLITAGAAGNLWDNFTQPRGGVRDFLRFSGTAFGLDWDFPAFNVADSCICVGALTLAFLLWRSDAPSRSREQEIQNSAK